MTVRFGATHPWRVSTFGAKLSAHLEIDDLAQETYARLLQTRAQAPLRSAIAYLFTTARRTTT